MTLGDRNPPTAVQRSMRRKRLALRAVLWGVPMAGAFVVVCLLDRSIFLTVKSDVLLGMSEEAVGTRDWYQFLRQVGYLPSWIAVACALMGYGIMRQRERARHGMRFNIHAALRPGLAVFFAAGLSGLAAEILKDVIRRHRPIPDGPNAGGYAFDWFGHGIEGLGMGLPSSHAAVAFGGAFMLAYTYPGTRLVVLTLACGCAFTRLLAGAHFASDVFLAVLVSYAVAWMLRGLVRSVAMEADLLLTDGPGLGAWASRSTGVRRARGLRH